MNPLLLLLGAGLLIKSAKKKAPPVDTTKVNDDGKKVSPPVHTGGGAMAMNGLPGTVNKKTILFTDEDWFEKFAMDQIL